MFPNRELVKNPSVLRRLEIPPSDFKFISEIIDGDFYFIIPKKAREIFYIQMLGKNIDVFIPSNGNGLLIRRRAIDFL